MVAKTIGQYLAVRVSREKDDKLPRVTQGCTLCALISCNSKVKGRVWPTDTQRGPDYINSTNNVKVCLCIFRSLKK